MHLVNAPSVSIAVDERSNSILLGGPKAVRLRMRVLISQLDAPATHHQVILKLFIYVILEAKTFAPLLGKIAQNIIGKEVVAAYMMRVQRDSASCVSSSTHQL